jgi:hypothetical protein
MAILNRFNRDELGNAIEVLVALLDIWDGDPDDQDTSDAEDDFALTGLANAYAQRNGPGCFISDIGETAYVEWDKLSPSLKGVRNITGRDNEDDEEDNEDCGLDEGEPDYVRVRDHDGGAGCPIADPGGCEHDGREPDVDAESEQMPGDVPTLPVVSAEYNIFNDKRTAHGLSNLMSSFVGEARSADTGTLHKGLAPDLTSQPGVPV